MEEIHPILIDNIYKKTEKNPRIRHAVRGIIINDNNEVALVHIKGDDVFGKRDHFELPGGGIEKGEDEIKALKREIAEEIGFEIKDIKEVGIIANEYNVLKRIDVQHFYLAKTSKFIGQSLLDYEKGLFNEVIFYPLDKVLAMYKKMTVENVGILIHNRDSIAIKKAIEIIEKEAFKKLD